MAILQTTTVAGRLNVNSSSSWAVWNAGVTSSSFMTFQRGGTSTPAGYIGTDGGGIIGGGPGTGFGIRSDADLILMAGAAERIRINTAGTVVVAGSVNPSATNTHDLGTAALRWRNIYTQDLHLSNGIGDYTIIEGEEDLFLVNNKSGRSFKFALIEVDSTEVPPKSVT